jgi:predicted metal-dependent enzyme (double-stranded beta helix superfamily)
MFDLDHLIADCRAALGAGKSPKPIREVVARAVADPAAILKALGEPERATLQTLHRASDLTILNVVWAPHMYRVPHNHRMWAVIGIYTGREDNIFWRRARGGGPHEIEAAGAKELCAGQAELLGRDIIHSVLNPILRLTGAIHVYGGDFFAAEKSDWDAESLTEQPWDPQRTLRSFEEAGTGASVLRLR